MNMRIPRRTPFRAGSGPRGGRALCNGRCRVHARPRHRPAVARQAAPTPTAVAVNDMTIATTEVREVTRTLNLRSLLEEMIERGASDLHITAGERPKVRVGGHLTDSVTA